MTILLHGFWGQPADWKRVLELLKLGCPVLVPDLYEPGPLSPETSLADWPGVFWKWVEQQWGASPVQIVGYSMGARLAVSAAQYEPERVSRALFLSGNPILKHTDYAERLAWENEWRKKFLCEDWAELEKMWHEQPIMSGSALAQRRMTSIMREALALSLEVWSPRHHPFTEEDVGELPSTCEWAFGALDQKYVKIAKGLQELPVRGQISLIPKADHRLITTAAEFIADWTQKGM